MLKVGILFITFGTVVFAANASDIIWTWGNGNSIASIFSFLYFLLNIDSLAVLIKYAAVIGMIVVFMREYAKGDGMKPSLLGLKMFLFFAMTQATVTFFLTVKQTAEHRIYILSANELSSASWAKCRPVNGDNECYAPIGIKFIFSALTNFEKAGLSSMESAMMDANALTYSFSRMGYGFGLNYIDAMSKTSVGTHQYNTFMEFYENCIIYDLSDGSKDVDAYY
ncbi:MAG: conjugal transfer protein TraG N-terminal domain-containing protein, partial [Sulfurospirillum sp.]|nr:conjugal transfer protein TraG N-terminal domain-containing protein [Sulfurospirillum sp.]